MIVDEFEKEKLLLLMDELITSLEPYVSNSTIRQIWLETHWLKQNLKHGRMALPRWELMVFKPQEELGLHKEAAVLSRKLADSLKHFFDVGEHD